MLLPGLKCNWLAKTVGPGPLKRICNHVLPITLHFQSLHQAQELTDQQIAELSGLSDQKHFRSVLDKILVPRVVGTANHKAVGDFIISEMKKLGWETTEDAFTDRTPIGNLNFRNIVAKLNPQADRFLMLACHYDSKYYREHAFVGECIFFVAEVPGSY